jgi:hypothetical protein
MNITALTHRTLCKLTLVGLLIFPLTSAPGYAVELVGKPVAVGRPSSSVASSVESVSQQAQIDTASGEIPQAPEAPEPPDTSATQNNIERAANELRNNFRDSDDMDVNRFMSPDIIIPVVAMSLLFGGPILLIIILALLHYRSKSRRLKNINMNIEKLLAAGRDIPLELLLGEEPRVVKNTKQAGEVIYTRNDEMMRKGVRNIGVGIGCLVFLTIAFDIEIGSFGFILIGLGISQVVIWRLSENRTTPVIDIEKIDTTKIDAAKLQD